HRIGMNIDDDTIEMLVFDGLEQRDSLGALVILRLAASRSADLFGAPGGVLKRRMGERANAEPSNLDTVSRKTGAQMAEDGESAASMQIGEAGEFHVAVLLFIRSRGRSEGRAT